VNTLDTGDRVRIDNPKTTDSDRDRYHGREGIIEQIRTDDAAWETDRAIDSIEYLVRVGEQDEEMRFRGEAVRPR